MKLEERNATERKKIGGGGDSSVGEKNVISRAKSKAGSYPALN